MTLNGVTAVILRYLSEFAYLPGVLRKSSRSLSHLLMSSRIFTAEKPTGVYEISSPGKSADLPASGRGPTFTDGRAKISSFCCQDEFMTTNAQNV